MPSLQETFDRVATHLLKQGRRAKKKIRVDDLQEFCAYRGNDCTSCAIGCLIPHDHYFEGMEGAEACRIDPDNEPYPWNLISGGEGPTTILHSCLADLGMADSDHIHMLAKLQRIHDCVPVISWRGQLRSLAKVFKLNDKVTQ